MGCCVYCGGPDETRDHVPSKILLDDPLPDQLPVVEACKTCNHSFSLDEEYVACLIEAILNRSAEPDKVSRIKIRRSSERNPKLVARIQAARTISGDGLVSFQPEMDRVKNVVLKLARGHAAYELSLPVIEEPVHLAILPLQTMSEQDRLYLENAGSGEIRTFPEIGSRAFLRACGADPYSDTVGPWVTVVSGQYRYSVDQDGGIRVRIVIAEYLACETYWE